MDARSTKTKDSSLSKKVEQDVKFRKDLLQCGNFAQATYQAFNSDTLSNDAGKSRYTEKEFLSKVKLADAENYKIHSFLYATTGLRALQDHYFSRPRTLNSPTLTGLSNWIGYVASNTDEKIKSSGKLEIFVVLRGSVTAPEWLGNFVATMVPFQDTVPEAKVHEGWLSLYTSTGAERHESLKDQISAGIRQLIEKHKPGGAIDRLGTNVFVVGHSLGGALATLAAYDLALHKIGGESISFLAAIFSAPPAGNAAFKKQVDSMDNLVIGHVWVDGDIIPFLQQWIGLSYVPIHKDGMALVLDNSPYLKNVIELILPLVSHNLNVVLHLLAGYNGDRAFDFKVLEDPALVRKYTDASSKFPKWWFDLSEWVEWGL